jgi:hypothetical protein
LKKKAEKTRAVNLDQGKPEGSQGFRRAMKGSLQGYTAPQQSAPTRNLTSTDSLDKRQDEYIPN